MKLTTASLPLVLLGMVTLPVTSADDEANWKACEKTNNNILVAIRDFCNKPSGDTIMVPSTYASNGAVYGDAKVYVTGKCEPAQWLPSKYCQLQFRQVCAEAGYGAEDFGDKGCQRFIIEKLKHPVAEPVGHPTIKAGTRDI